MSLEVQEEEEKTEIKETPNNEPKESTNICDKLCMHDGHRVCYNDSGDKETVKKIESEKFSSSSSASIDLDSIHSGESLFKTFTFDVNQEGDPDLAKCMEFWKNILRKNIKPVKCTLLKEKKKQEVKKVSKPVESNECDNEKTRKMWEKIYKDLQRRKLDQIKLVKKQKWNPCDECYSDEEIKNKEEKEEIKKLNNWVPQEQGTNDAKRISSNISDQIKRSWYAVKHNKESKIPEKIKQNNESKKESDTTNKQVPVSKESITKVQKEQEKVKTEVPPNLKTDENKITEPPKDKSQLENKQIPATQENISIKEGKMCTDCNEPWDECICEAEEVKMCTDCNVPWDECICGTKEFDDISEIIADCKPCTCGDTCICENHKEMCICGCETGDCICRKNEDFCACGCTQEDCICDTLDELENCSCGCGLDECMCQQIFTRSCQCGHADCSCDLVEIFSAYMQTLKPKKSSKDEDDLKFASKESQTDGEEKTPKKKIAKKGGYCVICGHHNCFCKTIKSSF